MPLPKLSLITTTFNSAATIASTLDSALAQTYTDFEHIIIDNQSSDPTLSIIESYRPQYRAKGVSLRVFSQRDSGIYDGMNKGLHKAQGDIVGFLNADDFFAHSRVLEFILWGFDSPRNVSIVYANVLYVDDKLNPVRAQEGRTYHQNAFAKGFHPPHPSFYAKREVFRHFGGFDLRYKIAADYELMLRFLHKHNLQSLYIDEYFVKMRAGGTSNASLQQIIKANIECIRAWGDNGLKAPPFFVFYKLARKLKDRLIILIGGGAALESSDIFVAFDYLVCFAHATQSSIIHPSQASYRSIQGNIYLDCADYIDCQGMRDVA